MVVDDWDIEHHNCIVHEMQKIFSSMNFSEVPVVCVPALPEQAVALL